MRLRGNLRLLALLVLPNPSARQRERRGVGLGLWGKHPGAVQKVCTFLCKTTSDIWRCAITDVNRWTVSREFGSPGLQLSSAIAWSESWSETSFSAFNFFLVSKSLLAVQGSLFCHYTICRGEKPSVSYISWWGQRSFPSHLQTFQDRNLNITFC